MKTYRQYLCAIAFATPFFLFSTDIFAMEAKAQDVECLVTISNGCLARLINIVPDLLQRVPGSSTEIRALASDALRGLENIQIDIVTFRDAYRRGDNARCDELYNQMLTSKESLLAIHKRLSALGCEAGALAHPQNVPNPAYVPAMHTPLSAIQASIEAWRAHLAHAQVPIDPRVSIEFDPYRIAEGGIDGIPQSLQQLPGVQVLYYPSPDMPSRALGTCGTRAIGNALAIRDTVLSGDLHPATVFRCSIDHNDLNSHKGTRADEAINLALVLHLDNVHCLFFVEKYPNTEMIKNNPFSIIESTSYQSAQPGDHTVNLLMEEDFQERVVQAIRNSSDIVVHFLCFVDIERSSDHIVLISIVKQTGDMPKIIYMDCNNEQVLDQSKAAAFIHYLYLRCFA